MNTQKIAKIVVQLTDLTNRGKVEWEITETDDTFQTSFSDFSIRVFPRQTPDTFFYVISLLGSDGTVIESANDADLSSTVDQSFSVMRDLWEAARGRALGIEQKLDSIISTLSAKAK